MIEIREIFEVDKFVIAQGRNLCYLRGNELVVDDVYSIALENNFGDIYSNNQFIIWQNYFGIFFVYDLDGILISNRKGYFNYSARISDKIFFYDSDMKCLKCLNVDEEDECLSSIKFNGEIIFNYFLYFDKNVIKVYSIKEDKKIFDYNIPEKKYDWYTKSNYENAPDEFHRGEIFRIIGEYNGVFWIVLNSGVLLGLNSETGELCYELIHPNNYHRNGQPFNLAINTQLDRGRGILFGLRNKYYWEVDLQNPATNYSLYNITESCNKWNISADMPVREWSWAGDKIYFGEIFDSPHNQKLNNVGVFDRANKEVIHAMRIGEGGKHDVLPNIQKIQFESGRLYVLDGRKVLHILE